VNWIVVSLSTCDIHCTVQQKLPCAAGGCGSTCCHWFRSVDRVWTCSAWALNVGYRVHSALQGAHKFAPGHTATATYGYVKKIDQNSPSDLLVTRFG